jgi:hypothetical protein
VGGAGASPAPTRFDEGAGGNPVPLAAQAQRAGEPPAYPTEQHCEPGRFLLVRRDSPARLYVATASASDEQ